MNIDKSVRRALLKPLVRRAQSIADRKALFTALKRLDSRALGEDLVHQLRQVVSDKSDVKSRTSWKDPARVLEFVTFTRALYAARRICTQEYVFYASLPIEGIADDRTFTDSQLQQILQQIAEVRKNHGLADDEDWPLGSGPEEYLELNKQYDTLSEKILLDAYKEFGASDLADFKIRQPKEFDRLRERGRRAVFHHDEYMPALRDIILRHEEDAKRAATARAYSTAVTSLGAGIEGLLLLRCLRSKVKAKHIARKLVRSRRPRFQDDPTTWTFENLIEVCLQAGWLPAVNSAQFQYSSARLAHLLRILRNNVHPGRQAKDKPWCEIDERDYEDANAIYITLLSTLEKVRKPKEHSDTPIAHTQ